VHLGRGAGATALPPSSGATPSVGGLQPNKNRSHITRLSPGIIHGGAYTLVTLGMTVASTATAWAGAIHAI